MVISGIFGGKKKKKKKSKIIFFSYWFILKNILILQNCFKAIQNGDKSECSRLE